MIWRRILVGYGFFSVIMFIYGNLIPKYSAGAPVLLTYLLFSSIFVVLFTYNVFPGSRPAVCRIRRWGVRMIKIRHALSTSQKLYVNLALLTIFIKLCSVFYRPAEFSIAAAIWHFYAGYIVLYESLNAYKKLADTIAGKIIIAVAFAVCSCIAISIACYVVSIITHAPASDFPRAVSLLAIVVAPLFILVLGSVTTFVGIVAGSIIPLLSMFKDLGPKVQEWLTAGTLPEYKEQYPFITWVFRLAFYTRVGMFVSGLTPAIAESYDHYAIPMAKYSAYLFDMYPGTECELDRKHINSYRLVSLGDDRFVPAYLSANDVIFEPSRKCEH